MIPKGRCLEEHYHYRQMVSQGGTSSSPVLQKATLRLGTDARMFSDFLLLLQMQGLFPSSSVSRQIIWAIWPLFPTFFPPWNKDSSWVALTRMLWMLLFKILKGQEKRDRVCARTGESRLRRAKEDRCPCLRSRLHALMDQYPSVLYPSGSARIYSFIGKLSISPPFAPYTIRHVPSKCFISGQQVPAAIPWISFAGFYRKSTQLYLCLSSIRALDIQMRYYGPSPARRVKDGREHVCLHSKSHLSCFRRFEGKYCIAFYHLQSH